MPGKLPIDRVREAQDAPKVYDEHRERFTSHQAELREADDPVSGARPAGPADEGGPAGESGLDPDASLRDREGGSEQVGGGAVGGQAATQPEDPDGP